MSQEIFRARITDVMATEWTLAHPTIPVHFENIRFDEPAGPWVYFTIIPNERFRVNIGNKKCFRQSGIVNIAVMVPEETGTKTLNEMVDTINTIFADRITQASDGSRISFTNSDTRVRGIINGFYAKNVMIEFHHDEI